MSDSARADRSNANKISKSKAAPAIFISLQNYQESRGRNVRNVSAVDGLVCIINRKYMGKALLIFFAMVLFGCSSGSVKKDIEQNLQPTVFELNRSAVYDVLKSFRACY